MTQNELRECLSLNIKRYRKRLFLTQEKLAERTGLSAQTINDIEGCRTWVSDKSLIKIADSLRTTPAELLLPRQDERDTTEATGGIEMLQIQSELTAAINAQIQEVFSRYRP